MAIRQMLCITKLLSFFSVLQLCTGLFQSSSVTKLQSLMCSMFKTTISWNSLICAIAVMLEKAMFDLTLVFCSSILQMTHCLFISLAGLCHFKEREETLLGCQSSATLGILFFYPGSRNSHNFRYIVFSSTSKEVLQEISFVFVLNMEQYGNAMEVLCE